MTARTLGPWVLFGLAAASSAGCVTATASAGQPTAVERQLLGAYEQLDRDLVEASSVRGVSSPSPERYEWVREEALEGRGLQRFNEDDLLELKTLGCVAETLAATIVARPCDAVKRDKMVERIRTRVIDEENRGRAAILRWAAYEVARQAGRSEPGAKILTEVQDAYRRLLREARTPGHLIEIAPGRFEGRTK